MYGKAANNDFDQQRDRMARFDLAGRDISDKQVLAAMKAVPREEFVNRSYLSAAYDDGPLPIGCGQTISQPYIVALMTQELRLNSSCDVLEIGTGSGYQTAILARLVRQVCTIEQYNELAERAQAVLGRLGYTNIEYAVGDGSCGWPKPRSFERIMVTAAVPQIPQPLLDCLVEKGLIVAPVGGPGVQELVVAEKIGPKLRQIKICDVRFVKLVGKYGFAK